MNLHTVSGTGDFHWRDPCTNRITSNSNFCNIAHPHPDLFSHHSTVCFSFNQSSVMSIEQSDFIFSVRGDNHTEQNLSTLVSALHEHGFQTQARPGTGQSALVFARISSQTYANVVARDLQKLAEFGVTANSSEPADRPRLVYSYLTSPAGDNDTNGVGITPGKGKWLFVESVLPNSAFLADKSVAQKGKEAALSPSLSAAGFRNTHGTQIALYFEFLKFYIGALGVLSIFGAIAFVKSKTYSLTYSFVNLAWGISFLLLWKRKERALVNLWGVQNAHKVEEYDADLATASIGASAKKTAAFSQENRAGRRFMRELAFIPIAIVFVAILVTYQLTCFVLEIFLAEIYNGPGKMFLTLVPTVLISVFVPILTIIYNMVVNKFLVWEGHDNNYTRYDSFVVKTFTLNFLTGYVPLLITSFIYLPFAHFIEPELPVIKNLVISNIHHDRYAYKWLSQIKSQREFKINQARLDGQFFYFIVTNQIILFVLKYGLPLALPPVMKLVNTKLLGKKEDAVPVDKPEEKEWLAKVRHYALLPEHNVHDDYRGLCLQFGYLAMFGPVWTLAPLLSVVFNIITFKLDTLKLTSGKYFRPPVPKRVDSIHPWDIAFFALAWLGLIISPAVAAFYRHGTKPPKTLGQFGLEKASVNVSSSTYLWLTLFASEHVFFALYFIGSKASSFLRSDKEVENSYLQHSKKDEKLEPKSVDKSSDWKLSSVEEVKKQAKGTGKFVSPQPEKKQNGTRANGHVSDEKSAHALVSEKAILSGVSTTAAGSVGTDQSLNNRNAKLAELEQKKAQLERVKHTLEKKQLEAQREKGDTIIDTIDSQGNKTQAIIDGDLHIDMSDVRDVERTLSKNEGKFAEKSNTGGEKKAEKEAVSADKDTKTTENSSEKKTAAVADVAELRKLESAAKTDSLEENSTSSKPSKKKSLKKFLKRG